MIILVLLLLLLLMPVGADVSYAEGQLTVKAKAGLIRIQIVPGKPKQKEKPKAEQENTVGEKKEKVKKPKSEKKLKLTKDDIFTLLGIVLRTLRRFRRHLSLDLLRLHWTAGAGDPYDAVIQYGAMNAGLSTLLPLAEEVLKIRERDLQTAVDLDAQAPRIDARIVATIQIWEILFIVIFAGAAALSWYLKKRKQARRTKKAAEQKGTA